MKPWAERQWFNATTSKREKGKGGASWQNKKGPGEMPYIDFFHSLMRLSSDDHKIYIHKIFGTYLPLDATSPKLRTVLVKIEETLIFTTNLETVSFTEDTAAFSSSIGEKVSRLPLQPDHPNQLYGLIKSSKLLSPSVCWSFSFLRLSIVNEIANS
jgi:hypothetical protein